MASSWLFPSGRHFNPTDDELLLHLLNYVSGQPFSCNYSISIPTVDLYGDKEPWVLFSEFSSSLGIKKKRDLYFYTQLKKKNHTTNGKRVSRVIGKGSWHGQDCGKKIFYEGKGLLGFKKSLIYQNQKNPTHDRQWLLKEYSLSGDVLDEIEKKNLMVPQRKDYVLCRMRRKKPKKVLKSEASNQQVVTGDLSDLFRKFQDKIIENFCSPSPQQDIEQFQEKMISPNLYYSQNQQQEILQFQDNTSAPNLYYSQGPISANLLCYPSPHDHMQQGIDELDFTIEDVEITFDDHFTYCHSLPQASSIIVYP